MYTEQAQIDDDTDTERIRTHSSRVTNLASAQLKRTSKGENTLKLGNWVIVIKMYFKLEISFGSERTSTVARECVCACGVLKSTQININESALN